MADIPAAGSSLGSFFSGNKRIPSMSFYGYLFSAVAVDVVLSDWLPGSGTAFVLTCRGLYMINNYKTDKMMMTTVATAIIGVVPILADVTNIVFVVSTYLTNVAETKPINDKREGQSQSYTQRAASMGSSYLAARSLGQGLKGFGKGQPEMEALGDKRGGQNIGHEQKGSGSGTAAPINTADKNADYHNDKSVDGVRGDSSRGDNRYRTESDRLRSPEEQKKLEEIRKDPDDYLRRRVAEQKMNDAKRPEERNKASADYLKWKNNNEAA